MMYRFLMIFFRALHAIWFPVIQKIKGKLRALGSMYNASTFKRVGRKPFLSPNIDIIGASNITLGDNVFLGKNGLLSAWSHFKDCPYTPSIEIGSGSSIGNYFHISAINKIKLGQYVLIGNFVTIVDNSHGQSTLKEMQTPPMERSLHSKAPIVIDDNVWIGDKVTILAGVHIGTGAIIGSNAVVTKDIPSFSIAGGIPAKVIKNCEYPEPIKI